MVGTDNPMNIVLFAIVWICSKAAARLRIKSAQHVHYWGKRGESCNCFIAPSLSRINGLLNNSRSMIIRLPAERIKRR